MSEDQESVILQATGVAINGYALLLEGKPGAGKSSLALALIERGGTLIGDDGVVVRRQGSSQICPPIVCPPPNIEGLLEVHGVGLLKVEIADPAPLAMILKLLSDVEPDPPRLPETVAMREVLGCPIPVLPFRPGTIAPAQRAMRALELHGRFE